MTLIERIDELIVRHGSLRAAARAVNMTAAYMSRLHRGEKNNPSPATLRKLKLRKVVSYERVLTKIR